jgi:hypothetical protein
VNLVVSVQTKYNEGDIGYGVDELGDVLAVFIVPLAPKLRFITINQ